MATRNAFNNKAKVLIKIYKITGRALSKDKRVKCYRYFKKFIKIMSRAEVT